MQLVVSSEVQELVAQRMATGMYANENEVLIDALNALQRRHEDEELAAVEDDWPAIKEALDGIENGTNKPMTVQQAFDTIRNKHGLL
jgi:Arc/MetJ-type ribon-helix-helix transcriptional regulator